MFGFKNILATTASVSPVILAMLLALTVPVRASSILIDRGSSTYDPATNLSWLDVTATADLSYNDVITNTGVDYIGQGWRYATDAEVEALYRDAGIPSLATAPDGGFFYRIASEDPAFPQVSHDAAKLVKELGVTVFEDEQNYGSGGMFVSARNPGIIDYSTLFLGGPQVDSTDSSVVLSEALGPMSPFDLQPALGSMLVRAGPVSEVPAPGALLLLATALATLGGVRARSLYLIEERHKLPTLSPVPTPSVTSA